MSEPLTGVSLRSATYACPIGEQVRCDTEPKCSSGAAKSVTIVPMLRRLLPLVLLAPVLTLAVSVPAHADGVPALYQSWPVCGTGSDTDGEYCIVSVTKDGAPVTPVDYNTDGSYDNPYVDLIGAGDVRFGADTIVITGGGAGSNEIGSIDPNHTWVFTVNTGAIDPNEMYGNVRDTALSFGGSAATGHTFTLTFKPAPIAWRIGDPTFSCSYDGGCGDDTTVADTVYDGFVTGYVTDDASSGLGAGEIADRHGLVASYNAQDAYTFYDIDTNTLEVRMANPHLASTGPDVPATGYFDTHLPNAYLIDVLGVPDPSSLTGGSLTVVRAGSSTSVPFTVTHESGGVGIHISGITFSRPRYKIHPKPTPPGTPRWGSVHRTGAHAVTVSFRKPRADGGKPVSGYAARCRHGAGAWHAARAAHSPITVTALPAGSISCQVRAKNTIGWGHWNKPRHT